MKLFTIGRNTGLFWVLMVVVGSAFALPMERYINGVHYKEIAGAELQPNSAVEYFSYGCPHCYRLEPELEKWLASDKAKGIQFSRVPAAWNKRYETLARLYFTLEQMGEAEEHSMEIFEALHLKGRSIASLQDAIDVLLEGKGINEKEFRSLWNSDAVTKKISTVNAQYAKNQVRGVPAMLVNGKYLTSVSMAGSESEFLEVVEFLLLKQ